MGAIDDQNDPVDVCTLGMFIIDEIDYIQGKGKKSTIIGGAGTYVALGARLVAGREHAASVGWIVDVGSDFPPDFRSTIESWQTRCLFREDLTRLTTRAWNGYGPGDERAFKYLTPKIRLEASSLPPSFLYSRVFHMVCSGARCKKIVTDILERRKHGGPSLPRPLFVWEPIPDLCLPSELQVFWEALRLIDVVSPNEGELSAYFGAQRMSEVVGRSKEMVVDEVMKRGIGPDGRGILVVRTGSRGCTAFSPEGTLQMRPYFLPNDSNASSERVVDPTGGGNTFLGGFCKALVNHSVPTGQEIVSMIKGEKSSGEEEGNERNERITAAIVMANVAASYAIEQAGMPELSEVGRKDLWNSEAFEDRVAAYITRERSHILEQRFL